MKTAVVIGSTGLIGNLLLEKLAQDSSFAQIIAICRKKPTDNAVFNHPKIRVLLFNFQNWSELELQVKSFVGNAFCSFFCCLGTTIKQAGSEDNFKKVDLDYVIKFASLSKVCKAEQLLIVSALGADANSEIFYTRIKGEMEQAAEKEFSGKIHFLRPSLLLGDRREFRFGERVAILLAPVYAPLLIGGLGKFHPVRAIDVAKVMWMISSKKTSAAKVIENKEIIALAKS